MFDTARPAVQGNTATDLFAATSGSKNSIEEVGAPDARPVQNPPSYTAPRRVVRVLLRQNLKKAAFSSAGRVAILSSDVKQLDAHGALSFHLSGLPDRVLCDAAGAEPGKKEFMLPCTLLSGNELNIIRFDGVSYRGSMILLGQQNGLLSIANYCDVEDYLRGVIPLEIGNCDSEAIEAIKAQAIAARTYTYKKMLDRSDQPYDLLPDISDQVYGGINAEKALCNQAIAQTHDLVIVYPAAADASKDSLIYAYYHSTCGGKTANVEDVWDKPKLPYLRSIDDCSEQGHPYCAGAYTFSWEESWPIAQFSKIINRFSAETFPQNRASGTVKKIMINGHFSCGRASSCTIITSTGSFTYGGDKIRFVLRKNSSGSPVLRSAVITDAVVSSNNIVIKGRGYGHGIGMCQFGAIGRANAGQNYEQIIKAYYSGVEIKCVNGQ